MLSVSLIRLFTHLPTKPMHIILLLSGQCLDYAFIILLFFSAMSHLLFEQSLLFLSFSEIINFVSKMIFQKINKIKSNKATEKKHHKYTYAVVQMQTNILVGNKIRIRLHTC